MADEMNETFMIRSSTPEKTNDDNELTTEKIQTKLTQVQLKTTLSDGVNPLATTQRHQIPSIELISLPKARESIVVNNFSLSSSHQTEYVYCFSFQM